LATELQRDRPRASVVNQCFKKLDQLDRLDLVDRLLGDNEVPEPDEIAEMDRENDEVEREVQALEELRQDCAKNIDKTIAYELLVAQQMMARSLPEGFDYQTMATQKQKMAGGLAAIQPSLAGRHAALALKHIDEWRARAARNDAYLASESLERATAARETARANYKLAAMKHRV
jgi:hypothetical protein